MTSQFSPKVSEVLAFSREEATRLSSCSVGPEHLMLGLLREKNGIIPDMLTAFSADRHAIKSQLEEMIIGENATQPLNTRELILNDKANNILKLAVLEARKQHAPVVDIQHLILAILHDISNGAKDVLERNNMNYEDALIYFKRQTAAKDNLQLPDEDDEDEDEDDDMPFPKQGKGEATATMRKDSKSKTPVLDKFSIDMTAAALEGKLDPVVGREREMERLTEILCRRKKNNPVLIGEPGVGKSAIVEGIAQQIVAHKTSPVLFGKRLVSLDMTAVVAGTKYRGQFEERIRAIIKEIEQSTDLIIFMDEIHTLIGAGSTPGSMDAANILKPALARGTIQCIGATTLDEYRKSIEKDGALERRFQKIIVEPTSHDETLQILQNIKDRYERFHHVTYSDEALQECVSLTERYVSDRFFPDKGIDAMDEAGAKLHLQHAEVPTEIIEKEKEIAFIKEKKTAAVQKQNFELAAGYRDRQVQLEKELETLQKRWRNGMSIATGDGGETPELPVVTPDDVAGVVAVMTGVPVQRLTQSDGERLRHLADRLKEEVIAQDGAIDKVVKAIQRNRIGLKEPNHPVGVFMFLGPTGVGKTYLAKKLAEELFGSEDAIIRIDMSEYTESFNTSRLVGAPPGYVGYDEGGQLTERVRRHPYSIVLLDEIEKAHGNVFNMLLQVLDEGRMTDGNGRTVDFRNTIIIMTSNAGTRQLKEFGRGIGFTAGSLNGKALNEQDKNYARQIIQKSLSKQFAPEFLNRLDEIVTFDQLDMAAIKRIIDIELKGLYRRVADLGYGIDLSDEAKTYVATKGYDVQFGARPLKRAIQQYLEDGICERILSGDMQPGDRIAIGMDKGEKVTFTVESQPST